MKNLLYFVSVISVIIAIIIVSAATGAEYVTTYTNKIGDYVLSQDVETGEVLLREVTDTFIRTSDHLRYLETVDENGVTQIFETTDAHPFWVVTDNPDLSRAAGEYVDENGTILYHENLPVTENGYYVEAKDLKVGDIFIGANGELTALTDTYREEFPNGMAVYNFTVEGNHNYYVIANLEAYQNGASVVLVHNADSILYRFGRQKDSVAEIEKQCQDALTKGIGKIQQKIHGISVTETVPPPTKAARSAPRTDVECLFPVYDTPTTRDINHKTVEFPDPVTPETIKAFYQLFRPNN